MKKYCLSKIGLVAIAVIFLLMPVCLEAEAINYGDLTVL